MAEDQNIPKFEDTEPLFEDTTEIPEEDTKMSAMQSFGKGVEQGTTLGFADEMAGGIQSGMDKLAKLGVPGILPEGVTETPDQVTEKLKAQGMTGDLPSTYEGARDDARAEYAKAKADNSKSYLGGNIAGGALTAAAAPVIATPFGSAAIPAGATEAGLLARAGMGAANAAPVGAAAGLGTSEADNIKDMAIDTTEGALTSAAIGGAIPVVGAGIKSTFNKGGEIIKSKAPSIHRAYEKGKEGIKTYGEDFQQATNDKLMQTSNKLKEFVLGKRNELAQKNDEIVNHLGKQIDNTEKDIVNYRKAMMEKQGQRMEKSKLGYAKQIEEKLLDQKAKVGQTYDAIENQIGDADIRFDMREQIANLGEDLQVNGLLPEQAAQIQGRFEPYFKQETLSLPELKQMKILANRMMESKNPSIKASFRKMYGQINESQIATLEGNGMTDVARNLRGANQKYTKLLDLEDNFIGDLSKDRILKQTLTDNDTLSTLDKIVKTDAKSLNATDILNQKAQNLDPKFGNLIGNIGEDLQNKSQMINNIPSEADMMANSGELQRLKALLQGAKAKPEVKNQMDALLQSDEKGINDYIGNNMKNVNNPIIDPARQNFENVLSQYQKATGKSLNKDASEVMKDTELVKNATEEMRGMISPRSLGVIESTGQYPANMAGRAVKNISDKTEAIKDSTATMRNVFTDDIKNIYANVKRFNTPDAALYAKQLETAMNNGTRESKNAALFSLMQQPAFRQMMNLNKKDENR